MLSPVVPITEAAITSDLVPITLAHPITRDPVTPIIRDLFTPLRAPLLMQVPIQQTLHCSLTLLTVAILISPILFKQGLLILTEMKSVNYVPNGGILQKIAGT